MDIFANVIIHIISNKVLTSKTYKYMKKIEEKKTFNFVVTYKRTYKSRKKNL